MNNMRLSEDASHRGCSEAKKTPIRYTECGDPPTGFQRDHAMASGLYAEGDCILIWINESDLCDLTLEGRTQHFSRKAEGR